MELTGIMVRTTKSHGKNLRLDNLKQRICQEPPVGGSASFPVRIWLRMEVGQEEGRQGVEEKKGSGGAPAVQKRKK